MTFEFESGIFDLFFETRNARRGVPEAGRRRCVASRISFRLISLLFAIDKGTIDKGTPILITYTPVKQKKMNRFALIALGLILAAACCGVA